VHLIGDQSSGLLQYRPDGASKVLGALQLALNMAARLVYKARQSCHDSLPLKELCWFTIKRRLEENNLTITFKARYGVAPSYLSELLRNYTPVRSFRSSDYPTLAAPTLKLRTVGHRSFCSSGPRAWNYLPPSPHAGALAYNDATPGTVSALIRWYLLPTYFDGFSTDSSSLPATSVVRSLG